MSEVPVTVRAARDAAARRAALADWLAAQPDVPSRRAAAIFEGALPPAVPANARVEAIAGCLCCIGRVALGVTLTRLLRSERPTHLLLVLASDEHLDRVRRMLGEARFAMLRLVD